jgi:hypothetical protein
VKFHMIQMMATVPPIMCIFLNLLISNFQNPYAGFRNDGTLQPM